VIRGANFGASDGAGWRPGSASPSARVEAGAPNREAYAHNPDNPYVAVSDDPLSTFAADVDTAAYSNVRRFLSQGRLPPIDAVRVEEMINYFGYDYPAPTGDARFAAHTELSVCPWNPNHYLVRIGVKGKVIAAEEAPPRNLVFLVDVSGSMDEPDKLPLVKASLSRLVDTLRAQDSLAVVVYAGAAGVVLRPTSGDKKLSIRRAIDQLHAGGSTAGGAGIELAYGLARERFDPKGANRVILATDGDFNVGPRSDGELVRLIEDKRKSGVHLTVLGFGSGNLNDSMMERLADKGDGYYAYIDDFAEAEKALFREAQAATVTAAKDVKIQVEWNPAKVADYRLIGYDNRALEDHEFRDDRKDAGDLGRGHQVTALYEVRLRKEGEKGPKGPALRYQEKSPLSHVAEGDELLTVGVRYKSPDGAKVREFAVPVSGPAAPTMAATSDDFRFAAAVAEFGEALRGKPAQADARVKRAQRFARSALGADAHGERGGLVAMLEAWPQIREESERAAAQARAWARKEAQYEKESRAADLRAERLALREERAARKRSPAKALAKASVLSPDAEAVLTRAAEVLHAFPGICIEISGHSDAREGRSDAEREALSKARAEAVRDRLVTTHGIDTSRLNVRVAGASEPIDTNDTARGRAKNRRVEFTILVQ
jgi:Ca-activated chloride channel family protein